jgi:hypothetical protein
MDEVIRIIHPMCCSRFEVVNLNHPWKAGFVEPSGIIVVLLLFVGPLAVATAGGYKESSLSAVHPAIRKKSCRLTQYLTRSEDIPAYAAVRTRFVGDTRPASMLLVIPQLVRPESLVEVEVIAAKAQ